jgi:hypothetical protein
MKLKVTRAEMWKATIDDRPGGAAAVLDPVAQAGANFEFAFARRAPEMPGQGLLFVLPVKGKKVVAAAQAAGLAMAPDMHMLRIEGADKPGTTAAIARAMADAGINFRALSATAAGRNFRAFLALDSAEDAARAAGALKKL